MDEKRAALVKIADLIWETVGPGGRDAESVLDDIAEVIDELDSTLWFDGVVED